MMKSLTNDRTVDVAVIGARYRCGVSDLSPAQVVNNLGGTLTIFTDFGVLLTLVVCPYGYNTFVLLDETSTLVKL